MKHTCNDANIGKWRFHAKLALVMTNILGLPVIDTVEDGVLPYLFVYDQHSRIQGIAFLAYVVHSYDSIIFTGDMDYSAKGTGKVHVMFYHSNTWSLYYCIWLIHVARLYGVHSGNTNTKMEYDTSIHFDIVRSVLYVLELAWPQLSANLFFERRNIFHVLADEDSYTATNKT